MPTGAGLRAGVDIGLAHPGAQRLRADPELRPDRVGRLVQAWILIAGLGNQANRPVTQLLRVSLVRHSGLDPSKDASDDPGFRGRDVRTRQPLLARMHSRRVALREADDLINRVLLVLRCRTAPA